MIHKTSELEGLALDRAVAKAAGQHHYHDASSFAIQRGDVEPFHPSQRWDHAGPIIERERIAVIPCRGAWVAECWKDADNWVGVCDNGIEGPTPLIAAMRAYVASKFGEEVDLP